MRFLRIIPSGGRIAAQAALCLLLLFACRAPAATVLEDRWYFGIGGGVVAYEGNEAVRDAALGTISIGYGISEFWSLEGTLGYTPQLRSTYRTDIRTGERISRLSEGTGRDLDTTSAMRFSIDALTHLAPGRPFNPYLAAGVGLVAYRHAFDQQREPVLRVGGGFFARITDRCIARVDGRFLVAGSDTEVNFIGTAGLVFLPGRLPSPGVTPIREPVLPAVRTPEIRHFVLYLHFDPGGSELKPEYRSELDVIGRLLQRTPGATARIEGHEQAEEAADEAALHLLSERRAKAIRDYFVESWGIDNARIEASGHGASRSRNLPDQSDERVEIFVTVP